eukprot:1703783-Amphidinium_carterae.3
MPGAQRHRYIQALRKETMILANIVSTNIKERTIVYPDWRVSRAGPAAATATPVSRRIGGSHHIKTVRTILFPTTPCSGLVFTYSERGVR